MSRRELSGPEAWKRVTHSDCAKWEDAAKRLDEAPVTIQVAPAFRIEPSQKVFCIGSCFARNIEEHLLYRGIEVLSKRIRCPKEEWPYRPNGIVNKFTTHSMFQELHWLVDPPSLDPEVLLTRSGSGWVDLQLVYGAPPVTLESAIKRRAYLMRDYFPRIEQADVVIVTLGLNEVWRDVSNGIWLNTAPSVFNVRRQPERYALHLTDALENHQALESFHEILKRINSGARMIVTVSPVPMNATFSGQDVLVANMRSKCTLRAAAETFCQNHEDVAYFPSFEMITLADRPLVYEEDKIHVRDGIVGHVTSEFIRTFVGEMEFMGEGFIEQLYLQANPDIDAKVRSGELVSGFHHWLEEGKASGRPCRPS